MDYKDGQSASSSSSSSSESFQPNPNIEISEPPLVSEKRKTGRKIFKETRHPIYKGVRQRNGNKWVCEVREPNKKSRIWLGTFPTPEMAARAYDVAALALRGESALLNFQDSAWLLERAKSCSTNDIQVAALAGAMLFRPPDTFSHAEIRSRKEFMRPSAINAPNVEEEEEEEECETVLESSRRMYVDEEELFNMPGLIDSMAEGMVITPPAMKRGFRWGGTGCEDIYLTNLWRDQ